MYFLLGFTNKPLRSVGTSRSAVSIAAGVILGAMPSSALAASRSRNARPGVFLFASAHRPLRWTIGQINARSSAPVTYHRTDSLGSGSRRPGIRPAASESPRRRWVGHP
jgi:hypothetical protein